MDRIQSIDWIDGDSSGVIGLTEPLANTVAFQFHERASPAHVSCGT